MYCTVEIQSGSSDLSLQHYGCTLPALVRRRRPQVQKAPAEVAPVVTEAPIREVLSTKAPATTGEDYDILSYPYGKKNAADSVNAISKTVGDDESSLNDIDSEPTRKPKRHIVYAVRQPVRVAIPARNLYAYQSRPIYQVASQPIVYRLQPQYSHHHQYQSTHYQPYYQPYYRTIAY